MYVSTFTALTTALSGIEASQEELQTTGNNIANASTPGYTEESVALAENYPVVQSSAGGNTIEIGTGVDALKVTSARNQFLDASYRSQNGVANNYQTLSSFLGQVQSTLNEGSGSTAGISAQLANFWNDWTNLANNPSDTAVKQVLVNDGVTLSQSFNQLSAALASVKAQAGAQYASLTGASGQVAFDANQIAQLNGEIRAAEAGGQNPNQLLDKRNLMIDDLSSLANVSVVNNTDGTVNVSFGDAALPLVAATTVNWPQSLTAAAGGTLGALQKLTGYGSVQGSIDQYSATLDTVASQLVTNVNAISTNPTFFSGNSASTIAVNAALVAAPANVQTTATSNPGANDVALAIAGLRGGQADQSYQQFVAGVGADVKSATASAGTQQALATAMDNHRQSADAVDLSQEESKVIMEQQAYQASASVMNAFNAMIGSLLQVVG